MLTDTIAQIEQHTTIEGLWGSVLAVFAANGVDFAVYISVAADYSSPFVLTNTPEIYAGADPSTDPFLSHCCHNYDITYTGPAYLTDHDYLPDEAKVFIKAAEATGFQTGLGIPMRLQGTSRFGGFNLGTRLDRAAFAAKIIPRQQEFRVFCLLAHRRIEELLRETAPDIQAPFRDLLIAPPIAALQGLSPREREVIYLVVQGISRKECARICGISHNTIGDYIKSAYRKLGVSSREEAAQKIAYM